MAQQQIISELRFVAGYYPGVGQSALLIRLERSQLKPSAELLQNIDRVLEKFEPLEDSQLDEFAAFPLLARVVECTMRILAYLKMPVFGKVVLLESSPTLSLAFPASDNGGIATRQVVIWVIGMIKDLASNQSLLAAQQSLEQLTTHLRALSPQGMNTEPFLQAARKANIPWHRLYRNLYRFGWGSRAHRLDSSFTEQTSHIATLIARHKQTTNWMLRSSGIPVPQQMMVSSIEQAVQGANKLGFPVVIKPADLDGGVGVSAGIDDINGLQTAYAKARQTSPNVLLEKHIVGKDYRMQVYQGEMFWAVYREPGSVTGDGKQTVRQLLDETNAHPLRGVGGNALLKRIELDEEAQGLLDQQGISIDSVPAEGQFVQLRRAANVASGGIPYPVLDKVHPDNKLLAERVVRVVGLDLAGVDLIMPDISQSWLDTGAAVIEVNAKPQLDPNIASTLFKKLFPEGGRIPASLVIGNLDEATKWLELLKNYFDQQDRIVGIAREDGSWVGDNQVVRDAVDAYAGGQALLNDNWVDVLLMQLSAEESISNGLPVDRLDLVVVVSLDHDTMSLLAWLSSFCQTQVLISEQLAGQVNETELEKMLEAGFAYCSVDAFAGRLDSHYPKSTES